MAISPSAHQKRPLPFESSLPSLGEEAASRPTKSAKLQATKKVSFKHGEPKVHLFDPDNGHGISYPSRIEDTVIVIDDDDDESDSDGNHPQHQVPLTEELTVLSTVHGRQRRELRDITKHDLRTVMKYGTKSKGNFVNGDQRWKFEFGNTVYITDNTCKKEITCYKKAIDIQPAQITEQMWSNHHKAVRILKNDPQLVSALCLCTTHSVIIIDQSGSMNKCDVNGFRSRSDAAFGTLALDYIAEQLYQQGDEFFVDAVTIIEMNCTGSLFVHKEPMDWILFNKVLHRQRTAKPRSHGNYVNSIEYAENVINDDLKCFSNFDLDDIGAYMLVLLSDGSPSDQKPGDQMRRRDAVCRLSQRLKSKLTVYGMGIGAMGSDFEQLKYLVDAATEHGAEGQFNHAGLSPAELSTTFHTMATSMTTTRTELLSNKTKRTKTEKRYTMRKSYNDVDLVPLRRETKNVSRWRYDNRTQPPWKKVEFLNSDARGFEVAQDPFGKGAERLAYMFYEIKKKQIGSGYEKVGKSLVAKNSIYNEDERSKEKFHTDFCRSQQKAWELALQFNRAVAKAPLLKPAKDEVSLPPPIEFLQCNVYDYEDHWGAKCGLLVEKFLHGRFTKFSSNNGYVLKDDGSATIVLEVGEVKLTDFLQAFSHWVYVSSSNKMLVCDLQGILDSEGIRPTFRLTDPAICSKERRYGKTDIGLQGIRNWCRTHRCSPICRALSLPPMGNCKEAKH
eukprot:scaffold5340_cov85-Skeletonema_dohrnii-CCMP3373.AAC.2